MATSWSSPTLGKGGIYEWTAGAKFSTMLGGSASTTVGAKTDVTVALANSFALSVSNSFKLGSDVGLSYGKSYSYKGADEVSFSKSSIGIQEYGGTRCLDLFQASAGLGAISRGMFEAQRVAVDRVIKAMIVVDVVAAAATVNISGFGAGFNNKAASKSSVATIAGVLTGISALASVISLMALKYLSNQRGSTKPSDWKPTAVFQASSQNGILVANHQGLPQTVYSSFTQNAQGSALRVSRGNPAYTFSPVIGVGALDDKHIRSLDCLGFPTQESEINMTEGKVSVKAGAVAMQGYMSPLTPLPGSKMSGTFQDIDLVSTVTDANGPSAQLNLKGTSPVANLFAGAAGVGSSVKATPNALSLKSGEASSVALGPANIDAKSTMVSVAANASLKLSGAQVNLNGQALTSIQGALVRLG